MLSGRSRALRPALVLVALVALLTASCRSKAASDAPDAAPDAASGSVDATASVDASMEASAALATAHVPIPAPAPTEAQPTPFTGSYRCFKGMQLEQVGRYVTSTMHTNATTDTVIACAVTGNDCTGTVRDIQAARGKAPKVLHVKPVTLHRTPTGDVMFKIGADSADSAGGAGGGARASKPAAGDQTFCPRR